MISIGPSNPNQSFLGRSFVKQYALCHRIVVCLSVRSVTLVYSCQNVGWIKVKLGMEVGLSPGDIVLDGDLSPLPKGGTAASHFWPMSVVAKRLDGS